FQEKHVTRTELVQYIQKLLKSDSNVQTDYTSTQYALTTSLSSISIKNTSTSSNSFINLPNVKVVFLMHEKLTANMRRRYENQVTQSMSSTLIQFAKKESFWVLVVDLPPSELNALVGAINPREVTKKETESEINVVIESLPKISLEESKGISDTLLEGLLQNLNEQAASLKGEVMIYDLTQTVQSFLHAHNKPPPGSLYDQMLEERKKRQEELLMEKMQKENEHRQALQEEIQRRKELFQKENRRREPRRSMSESNRQASSSESSENSSPYFRGHVVSKCLDHRSTETLYFPKIGRQIRRGCCVGHSQKGCIAYSGLIWILVNFYS
uniref:RWD domain-containing protein n=1 Tax=Megaselia scalaris TaxID=36166 RepID=T1GUJ7_MEGSC